MMNNQLLLETANLNLRPMNSGDAEYFFETWNNLDFRRYLFDDQFVSHEKVDQLIAFSEENFAKYNFGFWTITLKRVTVRAGVCGLLEASFAESETELLFGVEKQFWRQGLATEASRAVLKYAFETLALPAIYAAANPANVASWRVLEKLNMRFERTIKTEIEELRIYALRQNEFKNK